MKRTTCRLKSIRRTLRDLFLPGSTRKSIALAGICLFASTFLTTQTARAGAVTWNNSGTGWTTGTNWVGGAVPTAGNVAAFTTGVVASPNVNTPVSIAGLYFSSTSSSGYSITRSSPNAFTLTGYATSIGAETGDADAVAIGASNTTGTNTIAVAMALAPASGTGSTFFQAAGGTLILNSSITVISGAGITLNLTGGGTISVGAINTFSGGAKIAGPTVINAGTGSVLGSGTLELNSGTYKSNTSTTRTLGNVVSITGDFTFDAVSSGINEFTGGGSTTGDRIITVNTVTTRFVTNAFTLGGNLTTTGNGRLNFAGGLNLGGTDRTINAGATGSGGNYISGAIDSSAVGNKLILTGSNFSIGSSATGGGPVTPGATNIVNFDINATGTIGLGNSNSFLGSVTVEAGTVNVTNDSGLGSSTAATAGLFMTPTSGTATVNFTSPTPAIASLSSTGAGMSSVVLGSSAAATTLTVGGNDASTVFTGVISDRTGTFAAGVGSLTKSGSGALTLVGAMTYTGTTSVNSGMLTANGSLASTLVSTASNATVNLLGGLSGTTSAINSDGVTNIGASATLSSLTVGTSGTAVLLSHTGSAVNVQVLDITGLTISGTTSFAEDGGKDLSEPGSPVPVPEPGTVEFLVVGALGVFLNRRRR